MIPLRDTIPSSRAPLVNYVIIAVNVAIFLYETSLGRHLEDFLFTYGLVPRHFTVTWDPLESTCRHASLSIL